MRDFAAVEKGDDGKFYIVPARACASGIPFKEKWQADHIADALNIAYERGQDGLRAQLRDLLKVPSTYDL